VTGRGRVKYEGEMSVNKQPALLILKPPGEYRKFRDLAAAQGWILAETERKGPNHPLRYKETYTNADYSLGLRYIEDGLSGLNYFDVAGPAQDESVKILEAGLSLYSEGELLTSFDQATTEDEVAEAVVRLGVASPMVPNERFAKRFVQALKHSDPDVREAALVAVSYRAWNEFKPIIQDILDHDPADGPRERARLLIENWDKYPHG
jgi:hypothetical protein